jgi:hypothetical protein
VSKKQTLSAEQQLAADQAGRANALAELNAATDKWVADPKNPELIAEREGWKQEVELFDVRIARAQAALAAAAAADTAQAKAEATRRIDAEYEAIVARHKQLADADQKIAEHFDALAPMLALRAQLADDQQAGAWTIAKACAEHPERVCNGSLLRQMRHEDVVGPLVDRIYASGLGRGLYLAPWVDVSAARVDVTLEHVSRKAEEASLSTLRKLIAQRKAKVQA